MTNPVLRTCAPGAAVTIAIFAINSIWPGDANSVAFLLGIGFAFALASYGLDFMLGQGHWT